MVEEEKLPTFTRIDNKDDLKKYKIEIPECCREGWDSCPHVVNREIKKKKKNIGL